MPVVSKVQYVWNSRPVRRGGVGGFERTFFIIIIIIIIIVKGRETKQEPTNNTKNYVKTKTKLPRTKLKQKLN